MQHPTLRISVLATACALAQIARAQQSLPLPPFNQPVICPDGLTYIVEGCQPSGASERCIFRSERNGQVENRAHTWREIISEKLKACKAPAGASSAASPRPGGQ